MLHRSLLVMAVGSFLLICTVRADTVWVKGQAKPIAGTVKSETAKDIQIQVGKQLSTVVGTDVTEVVYSSIKLASGGTEYTQAAKAEKDATDSIDPVKRKTSLKKAIADYTEAQKKYAADTSADKSVYLARQLKYKIALLSFQLASSEGSPPTASLTKLQSFKAEFPNSWQINQVMPLIVQLQMDAGNFKEAEKTYQEIAENEAFPDDVRRNAELMSVQVSVRSGNLDQAAKRLDALAKKAGTDAVFASRVKMFKSEILVKQNKMNEAVPLIQQVIKENNDKFVKALAHNTLGECYFSTKNYDEALWEFLWVDAVYNQDKEQRARALYFLAKTFTELRNTERAQECHDMLISDSQFVGTEYQRKALAKK